MRWGVRQTAVVGMGVLCMVSTVRAEGILSSVLLKSFIYFISLKVLYITCKSMSVQEQGKEGKEGEAEGEAAPLQNRGPEWASRGLDPGILG